MDKRNTPARQLPYAHRNAEWSARFARESRERGDVGRSILLYEHALNYEIDALNECLQQDSPDTATIRYLYRNAAAYAVACGRSRKAAHLVETGLVYADDESQAQELRDALKGMGSSNSPAK